MPVRFHGHKKALLPHKHHSLYLQRAWDNYGKDNFTFKPLLYCDPNNLVLYEQMCINGLHPEYNIAKNVVAFFSGRKHTEETKKKLSEASKMQVHPLGYHHTEDAKRRMSEATTGRRSTDETKRKISLGNIGKHSAPFSEEHKKKNSDAHKGLSLSEETKRKLSEALKGNQNSLGFVHTEETRRKMSNSRKGEYHSPMSLETKRKIGDANRGKQKPPRSEEYRHNISLSAKASWQKRRINISPFEKPATPDEVTE